MPLSKDKYLADNYLNASGRLRLGPIFMDLDALSGIITYKHTGEGATNVTAAVDRITIDNPLTELCDLEYTGQVTYAKGSSSMEVTCRVARARPEEQLSKPEDTLLTITFTLVSLDPVTKKSTPNPPLELTTDTERAIYKLGESRSRAKKALAKQSLREHHPNQVESALTHKVWLHQLETQQGAQSQNVTPMSKTRLHSALIMQPQYRNRHNFVIFGGFLLKQTYELAFCCAASFAHSKPTFVSADPCTFLHPVPVGSVLYLTATVVYCDPPLIDVETAEDSVEKNVTGQTRVSVRVDSRVRDVEHDGSAKPTGQFHYTFTVDRDVKVLPETYQEHMIYLDGRRRALAYVGE